MAAGKKSYQVELWGDIQVVYDRYEEGRKTLSELIRFFTDRIDADTSYAKDISKLVTKAYSVTERGSVGDLWGATKRAHEGLSKQYAELSSQIKRDVVAPLEVIKKNQTLQKDMLEKKVEKLVKDLAKAKENWQKAKQKYYSCKKAAELALATYDRAQSDPSMQTTKLSKLNTAQQQAKKEAEVAEAAYRLSIKEFNLTQTKHEEEMIKILAEFQDMEMKRIEAVQDAMQKFNMVLVSSATGLEQNRLLLYKSTEAVNAAADVQLFIEDHKTGQTYPAAVEFEPYVDMAPAVPAKPNSSTSVSSAPAAAAAASSRPKSEMMGLKKDEINQLGKSTDKKEEEAARKKKEEEEAAAAAAKRKKEEDEKRKKEEEKKKAEAASASATSTPVKAGSEERRESKKDKKEKGDVKESGKDKTTKKEPRKDEPEKKDTKKEEHKKEEPKKAVTTSAAAAPTPTPAPAAEPVIKAKAVFDYKAGDDTELSFKMGDIIVVTHQDPSGWWDGSLNGKTGMFPGNYVELVKEEEAKKEEPKKEEPKKEEKKATVPAASPAATSAPSGGFVCGPGEKKVKILFHFEGSGEDELKVNEGDIVIIEEEVKGWYVGRNAKGQSGMFPANYAEDIKD